MNYQITVHGNPNYFEIKTEGTADVAGFESFLNEIFSHSDWTEGKLVLLDHSELSLKFFNSNEVRSVSNIVLNNKELIGKGKWAFVISGSFAYGMARMWQIITEEKAPMEINIFKGRDQALKWLLSDKLESKNGEN